MEDRQTVALRRAADNVAQAIDLLDISRFRHGDAPIPEDACRVSDEMHTLAREARDRLAELGERLVGCLRQRGV